MYNHNQLNQRLVLIDDMICLLDGTGRRAEGAAIFKQLQEILLDHFAYEEHCIMTPTLAASTAAPLIYTVLQIVREHGEMTSALAGLSVVLETERQGFEPWVDQGLHWFSNQSCTFNCSG